MNYGRCEFLKEWSNWDSSVHENEDQIIRQGRAKRDFFNFALNKDNETARFQGNKNPYYDTSLKSCTCPDFQERKLPCKHVYKLAVELGIIKIIDRKGTGFDLDRIMEIKTSGDIDSAPEQKTRIASSVKCKIFDLDTENQTGKIKGSGKDPYLVTLKSCTCQDFRKRKLPCKHIYKLRSIFNK